MPTPRGRTREPSQAGALAVLAVAATLLLLFVRGHGDGLRAEPAAAASAGWFGLVGEGRAQVSLGQRMLVVLKAPSLADRVKAAGGLVDEATERRWSNAAAAAQKELLSRLALQGVPINVEFTYTRVLNGFSAALDPRAVALLERAPEVQGVYAVRVAYPAAGSGALISKAMKDAGDAARPPGVTLPGHDGGGVTIALLDTGVDTTHQYLRGRVLPGRDLVSGAGPATAQAEPSQASDVERHGTEMAGVLVGHGGPYGLHGIAPGATVLPLRVAGWQRDASGGWAVYGRTDQLIAGLEAAVDPNRDGDAHDAARVALIGLAEPYASFADSPEARAVDGALALDTLVVAPAGNDFAAGPAFGSLSGPGGARGALTVGAADLRRQTEVVRVAVRAGLDIRLSGFLPLAGAYAPEHSLDLELAQPRAPLPPPGAAGPLPPPTLSDFFDTHGRSIVAGRVALVPASTSPEAGVERAARAGAYAVFVYGSGLPAGALGLDEKVVVPVVALPAHAANEIRASLDRGESVTASIGAAREAPNAGGGRIAYFSSRGLAYDGSVKPDLVGPGVTVPTAEPGTNEDGSPRFGTVNGTSVAAAALAGTGALLAQARPALGASDLLGLLVGTARRLPSDPIDAQGAGLVALGRASAGEVAAEPATLSIPPTAGKARHSVRRIVLHNVSTRRLRLSISGLVRSEQLSIAPVPRRLRLAPGRRAKVKISIWTTGRFARPVEGALKISPEGGTAIRVPWVASSRPATSLVFDVSLSQHVFKASDTAPSILTVWAGRLFRYGPHPQLVAVRRLEIALKAKNGKSFGTLAQVRDLIPYSRLQFGLTGRAPTGQILGRGVYRLIVRAYPTVPGPPSRAVVRFRIQK
jgi:subtilisin family serine protease